MSKGGYPYKLCRFILPGAAVSVLPGQDLITDQRLSLLTAGNPQPLSTSLNAHYLPELNALYDQLRFFVRITYGLRLLCLSAQAC